MTRNRHSLRSALALAPVGAAAVLLACNTDLLSMPNYGSPPDGMVYNAGSIATTSGSTYGSGSTSTEGGTPVTPAGGTVFNDAGTRVCPPSYETCSVTLTFADPHDAYTSVVLNGDWNAPASWSGNVKMTKSGTTWTAPPMTLSVGRAVEYKFVVGPVPDGGNPWVVDSTQPIATDGNNILQSVSCASPTCQAPTLAPGVFDWHDAVIYSIYTDRFFDSDGQHCSTTGPGAVSAPSTSYLGGDWLGIQQKLSYLQDLGVNTIWLTMPADNTLAVGGGVDGNGNPDGHYYSGYHGYWPTTLDQAEHCFASGAQTTAQSLTDLQNLVGAIHQAGMKVLIDYVSVQTHTDSPLWQPGPQQHLDWFWPNDDGTGKPCICNNGGPTGDDACSWNNAPTKCWFAPYLPHWNYTVPAAVTYSVDLAVKWISQAAPAGNQVDGFRLDAVKNIDASWVTALRSQVNSQIVASKPQGSRFYMVGETFSYTPSDLIGQVDPATQLDGQFDFPMRRELLRTLFIKNAPMNELESFMTANDSYYAIGSVMSPFLGNADLGRVVHMADDTPLWDEYDNGDKNESWNDLAGTPMLTQPTTANAYERMAVAFTVMFTNQGAPLLYYGDEFGLAGANDPDNRRPMPFCAAANLQSPTVMGRVCTPSDGTAVVSTNQQWLHDRVAKLLSVRKAHVALRQGARSTLSITADTWVYSMATAAETVYVAINRSDSPQTIALPTGTLNEQLTGATVSNATDTLPARQTRIYLAQ